MVVHSYTHGFRAGFVLFLLAVLIAPIISEAAAKKRDVVSLSNAEQLPEKPAAQHMAKIPLSATRVLSASPVASATDQSVDRIFAAVQNQWDQRNSGNTEIPDSKQPLFDPNQGSDVIAIFGRMLISLAVVILLGLGVAWLAKRYVLKGHSMGGGYIERLGSYNLSPKTKIHLLRVGKEHFLIGEGNNSLSLISRIDAPADVAILNNEQDASPAEGNSPPADFHQHLTQWHHSLENRNLRQEINASLLFLKGLSSRLRRKGGRSA